MPVADRPARDILTNPAVGVAAHRRALRHLRFPPWLVTRYQLLACAWVPARLWLRRSDLLAATFDECVSVLQSG